MPVVTPAPVAALLKINAEGDDAALLTLLCQAANAAIEGYCGSPEHPRQFDLRRHTEYHDITPGQHTLWLNHPPLATLVSLTDDANTEVVTNRSNRAIDVDTDVEAYPQDAPYRLRLTNHEGCFTAGLKAAKVVYDGGYRQQDLPADLVLAGCWLVAAWWEGPEALTRRQQILGGDVLMWRDGAFPPQVLEVLKRYKRMVI